MSRFLCYIAIMVLFLSGCSFYSFSPKGRSTINAVTVERFQNKTAEYGLEDRMTDLIIDALIADGNLKVVPEENSDAVLSGSLVSYLRKPYNPDENDRTDTYSITMVFDVALVNPVDNVPVWSQKISRIGIYNLNEESETDGQLRAIELLVSDIVEKTTQNW